jgi:tetratricopeptide (TPR) repeat protein
MRRRTIGIGLTLVILAAAGFAALAAKEGGDLVVHEWGTFLAMSGSDGGVLEGMYHEEHALPAFVHARSRDQLRIPSVVLKGETPVIYFYTGRAQKVRVDVRFPRGIWTQWFPQAQVVGPQLSQLGDPARSGPRDGRILWCAELLPAAADAPSPPPPSTSDDALWNFARDVDAAFVRTTDATAGPKRRETDRFLFYRGLGEAPLPLRVSDSQGGTLELDGGGDVGIRHVFIVRVEKGRGSYAYLPGMRPGERRSGVVPRPEASRPLGEFADAIGRDLVLRLVESGLYEKEARAMVNTWRNSYFLSEGVRVLFVLPQSWTDRFIPLTIDPQPRTVVRVMVGRVELLTPDRERLAERAVRDLASGDPAARQAAFATLRDQGRYVEPVVRRVLRTTRDEGVRALCKRLLTTDLVTELRSAVHGAADGRRLFDDPAHVRAQLALLLREVGLDAEAKAEGRRALDALAARAEPKLDNHEARHALRATARAREAVGDRAGAVRAYERFLGFAGQAVARTECRGCHRDAGPTGPSWFRDWWAGGRYAALVVGLGESDRTIADLRAALRANRSDVAARLRLAYLLGAKGDRVEAETVWSELGRADLAVTATTDREATGGR